MPSVIAAVDSADAKMNTPSVESPQSSPYLHALFQLAKRVSYPARGLFPLLLYQGVRRSPSLYL